MGSWSLCLGLGASVYRWSCLLQPPRNRFSAVHSLRFWAPSPAQPPATLPYPYYLLQLPTSVEKLGGRISCSLLGRDRQVTVPCWTEGTTEYLGDEWPEKKRLLLDGSEPLLATSRYLASLVHRFKDPWGVHPSAMVGVMGSWRRGNAYLNYANPSLARTLGRSLQLAGGDLS